jgi:quercetin dioxygenase-like cupin family protein
MKHHPAEHQHWQPAPQENFTGRAWFGPMAELPEQPTDVNILGVMFEPGARTDWHAHPGGQDLYVVTGAGRVQTAAGETVVIGPGDVVHSPPGEVHWHGAAPDSPMVHLSITNVGPTVWESRKVTDDEYTAG